MEHSKAYLELMSRISCLTANPPHDKDFKTIIIDLFGEQINEEFEVAFSDEQTKLLMKYKCNITSSPEKKQRFSKGDLINLISLLLNIIVLINSFLPNAEEQKQTQLLQQEVAELQEENTALKEIIDLLKSSATPDQLQ